MNASIPRAFYKILLGSEQLQINYKLKGGFNNEIFC